MMCEHGLRHYHEAALYSSIDEIGVVGIRGVANFVDRKFGYYMRCPEFGVTSEVHAEDILGFELDKFDENSFLNLIKWMVEGYG